jgi:hypothetical protein
VNSIFHLFDLGLLQLERFNGRCEARGGEVQILFGLQEDGIVFDHLLVDFDVLEGVEITLHIMNIQHVVAS